MRRVRARCASLALLLASVAPCGAGAGETDRSEKLLGHWACTTEQGNATVKTIVRGVDGSIDVTNVVNSPNGATGTIRETYVRAASGGWTLKSIPDPGFPFGTYDATARAWTGPEWVFDGTQPMIGADGTQTTTNVRLVYTDLFPAGFRREHQVRSSGSWRDVSEEVCKRA